MEEVITFQFLYYNEKAINMIVRVREKLCVMENEERHAIHQRNICYPDCYESITNANPNSNHSWRLNQAHLGPFGKPKKKRKRNRSRQYHRLLPRPPPSCLSLQTRAARVDSLPGSLRYSHALAFSMARGSGYRLRAEMRNLSRRRSEPRGSWEGRWWSKKGSSVVVGGQIGL